MRLTLCAAATAALLASTIPNDAGAAGYPWKDHAPPYAFTFGNDIDTHQQTRRTREGGLFGFFYVRFTGETTGDGWPVANHANCAMMPGQCEVGWILRGLPASATFLYHEMHDHPVWLLPRAAIPQPGAYGHFHWLGPDHPMPGQEKSGYVLELQAVSAFCFVHHEVPAHRGATCVERGGVPVSPGIDIATHLNIVSSFPSGDGNGGH